MNEKPFQKFDDIEISEEEIESLRKNSIKPEDFPIPSDKETLFPYVEEKEVDISPEDFHKIAQIKKKLVEKIVSVIVVKKINDFAFYLKDKYGESVYDNALYGVLIGSTFENGQSFEDFEGDDSIIKFVEEL